ncbi:MAG: helix-turn-helix domain-containing protein [Betaproteobacteria bacterium]
MQQRISIPHQFGALLIARRKALKLSQQAVAAKLGISQNRLSELEEDPARLTLERLIALANALGLDLMVQDKPAAEASPGDW